MSAQSIRYLFHAAALLGLALISRPVPASQEFEWPPHQRRSDVIYGRRDGLALTMEVFTPPGANRLGVLWVVSSSGRSGRDQTMSPGFGRRIAPFLRRGYTVFAVIHSSSPRFQLSDHVEDVRRAVRFVSHDAATYGVDPERLALAGSSSGGHSALLVALTSDGGEAAAADPVARAPSRVQAAGAFFAPADLVRFSVDGQETVVDFLRRRYGAVDPSFEFFHSTPDTGIRRRIDESDVVRRMLGELSPMAHATPDDPPTILIHGTDDVLVPVEQSRLLAARLKEAGVPVRLVERDGSGHAWPGWEDDAALMADWFTLHLHTGAKAPRSRVLEGLTPPEQARDRLTGLPWYRGPVPSGSSPRIQPEDPTRRPTSQGPRT